MTRIVFTTVVVALLSAAAVNTAAAQAAAECNRQYDACRSGCNAKSALDERYVCQGGCEGAIQGCLSTAAVLADLRAKEFVAKAIEERKKITCTASQGNVAHCIQHGQDLLPAAAHFKGGDVLACNKQYDTCRSDCTAKNNALHDRQFCLSSCEGAIANCLRFAVLNAEMRVKELKAKAIEERKKITCTASQGNVANCIQHGKDLLP